MNNFDHLLKPRLRVGLLVDSFVQPRWVYKIVEEIKIDKNGKYEEPVKVLETDYHLSYPHVFKWQDDFFMIPETGANKTIELYRCRSFPDKWELEKVLMENVRAVDATVAEIDGVWWMFVNIAVEGMTRNWDELHLFYADTPLGPWQPHKRNPVKSDARNARPAGRLFKRDGALYRPSQDCSRGYGYAVSVNKIVRCDANEFVEEEAWKILPQ